MASLSRVWRWEKWAPDIGENLSLPDAEQLKLEVASGMTPAEFGEWTERLRELGARVEGLSDMAPIRAAYLEVLSPYVRVVGEHEIAGKPVTNLGEYLAVVMEAIGAAPLHELFSAVRELNSVEGVQALFSARRAGGMATTRARPAAEKESE